MTRYLVVNADDFGYAEGVNTGISPSGDGEPADLRVHARERSPYLTLDGPQTRLCGPPAEAAAVVLER